MTNIDWTEELTLDLDKLVELSNPDKSEIRVGTALYFDVPWPTVQKETFSLGEIKPI